MIFSKLSSYLPFKFGFACLIASHLALISTLCCANDDPSPAIPANAIQLTLTNPERNVGFMMGDFLSRTAIIEVKNPYKLVETTLPIVGYEHRYKGQVSGIELRKISHTHKKNRNSITYTIDLTYQVFTTAPVVKPAILPGETIKFHGPKTDEAKDGLVQYTIPPFYFRISPMAVYGAVKVEQDLSPLHPPFLLQTYPEKQKLVICLVILGFSLLGLVYILGSRAWLPLMGKPFAQASRQLRRLSKKNNPANLNLAIGCVHHAINETAGYSVFANNCHDFFESTPNFKSIESEFNQFFTLSSQVFFEENLAVNPSLAMAWLNNFCKQCRDCERGLNPAKQKALQV